MKILIVSGELPWPPISGGRLRSYHLLRSLASHHDVTIVGFVFTDSPSKPDLAVRVIPVRWEPPPLYAAMKGPDPELARQAFAALERETDEPWIVSYYHSAKMSQTLCSIAAEGFDLVVVEGTSMGRFLPDLPRGLPVVINLFDVHSRFIRQNAKAQPQESSRVQAFERNIVAAAAAVLVCSEEEATAARHLLETNRVFVVPNGVDLRYFKPTTGAETGRVLFTGSLNYGPNTDAVRFFVREVLPLVVAAEPSTQFHVVGLNAPPEIRSLAGPHVVVWDSVPDIRPHLAAAEVVVVPIREGGGTRLKVLEAAAAGRAIVSTALGAEGSGFVDGRDLLLADNFQSFARATIDVLRDSNLRERLATNARKAVLPFDWECIGADYVRVLTACREKPQ